jgi:arginyl-tRNA synthetase
VQNYIDNTGVQVADVVVGFLHLEGKSLAEGPRAARRIEEQAESASTTTAGISTRASRSGTSRERRRRKQARKQKLRYATLHEIEAGGNETAEIAELISTAVLRRHLETMLRLDIEYDFLPRESEILHLKFWDAAFEQMKQTGVLYFETEGKNKGCWVMTRPGAESRTRRRRARRRRQGHRPLQRHRHLRRQGHRLSPVEVRPAGQGLRLQTVLHEYPDHECWISTEHGESIPAIRTSAARTAIYNVIDSRQNDPQANVIQALRGMGFTDQADHYTHFSYEMVALTPRCAVELGYTVSPRRPRPPLHRSQRPQRLRRQGRRPDRQAHRRHAQRGGRAPDRPRRSRAAAASPSRSPSARCATSCSSSRATRSSPSTSKTRSASRARPAPTFSTPSSAPQHLPQSGQRRRKRPRRVRRHRSPAVSPGEEEEIWASGCAPEAFAGAGAVHRHFRARLLAKHAFQLAQEFNNFYHKHHILTEEDPARKTLLLATAAVALRELIEVLSWLGIESPEAM